MDVCIYIQRHGIVRCYDVRACCTFGWDSGGAKGRTDGRTDGRTGVRIALAHNGRDHLVHDHFCARTLKLTLSVVPYIVMLLCAVVHIVRALARALLSRC